MVAIGLISFLGQLLLTVSLKVEEAGKVSIIRKSADILFAFAFQIIIFEVRCSHVVVFLFESLFYFDFFDINNWNERDHNQSVVR